MMRSRPWKVVVVVVVALLSDTTSASLTNALQPAVDVLTGIQYTAYQKGPTCNPSKAIQYPQTVADVQSIVRQAILDRETVKAFGHRHSATDIICTDGVPVDMSRLKDFSYDAESQTFTAGAGMHLHDATQAMAAVGRGLRTTPAWGNITIGGAIGTGAHGSTLRYNSTISDQVVQLTIVDGSGNIRTITDSNELKAFRLHLGLLGIITSATFYTVPLYKVTAVNGVVNDNILLNGNLTDMVRNSDQTTVYWYPSLGKLLIANWTIVDVATPGEAYTNDHVPPTSETNNLYAVPTLEIIQTQNNSLGLHVFEAYTLASMYTTVPDFAPIYTTDGLTVVNPATGYYDVMFAPICQTTGFWQCTWFHGGFGYRFMDNEMGIDIADLPDFAADLNEIVAHSPAAFPFDGILLRFSRATDTYMSTAFGRDTVHFEFYMMKRKDPYNDPSTGLAAYQAIMQTLAYKYQGRSHWGKSGAVYHSSPMLNLKLDQHARDDFIQVMQKYDPNGVFLNDFGKRLLQTGTASDIDPATTHCALLDNCICDTDDDCAGGTRCQKFSTDFDYNVCKNPSELSIPLNLGELTNLINYNGALSLQQIMCVNTFTLGQLPVNSALNCTPTLNGALDLLPPILG